jgi:hypothetical protein
VDKVLLVVTYQKAPASKSGACRGSDFTSSAADAHQQHWILDQKIVH